jgi:copper chaperone NosL
MEPVMKYKPVVLCGMLVMLILVISACTGGNSFPPEDIDTDTDVCAKCNMHIADDMFAAEYITKDGVVKKFDDLGCMIKTIKSNTSDIANIYVRDYGTEKWIDAKAAYYVSDTSIRTPMSNGVISFETEDGAKKFVDENGEAGIMNYEQLLEFEWPKKMK